MKRLLHKKRRFLIVAPIVAIGLCIYLLGTWGSKQFSENYMGRGDWVYNIDNEYSLVRTNAHTIYLEQKAILHIRSGGIIVNSYVSELAITENYLFVKQVTVPEDLQEKIDLSNPFYYVIARETGDRFGPYNTESEFEQALRQVGVTGNELPWKLSTNYKQDGLQS